MSSYSIGIFDSGVGGLTVFRELASLMPYLKIIYLGDTARVPYGAKSSETVTRFSYQGIKFLQQRGVRLIVVACNTVSALSFDDLQKDIDVPLIGVLKPGANKAVKLTSRGVIGVIGTKATIMSKAYPRIIKSIDSGLKVIGKSCPLLVPLIEEGWLRGEVTRKVVYHYLRPLIRQKIDTLILGCTHYPLIKEVIQDVVGKQVRLVDSAKEVALKVKNILNLSPEINDKYSFPPEFFVTDHPSRFARVGSIFLGYSIDGKVKKVVME